MMQIFDFCKRSSYPTIVLQEDLLLDFNKMCMLVDPNISTEIQIQRMQENEKNTDYLFVRLI